MTGVFYCWDRSIFQFQTMCRSSVELGLVYKTFVNKHTCKTPLLPRKTNCIHCLHNLQLKTHFLLDFSQKSCTGLAQEENAHIRSSTLQDVMKSHARKKLSQNYTKPERVCLAQKFSILQPNRFFFFFNSLAMFSMRIQLFNSVNNTTCIKYH